MTLKKDGLIKIIAVNGSPRKKNWNTITLLEHVLEGAESAGAQTELIHLYDLVFSGCISCFSCKKLTRKSTGVCAVNDDLTPILDRFKEADALIIGTPVYYGTETASTRAFLERLMFPYLNYDNYAQSHFLKKIRTAMIYTMNVPEAMIEQVGYKKHFELTRYLLERHFGACELLLSADTMQFRDYDKYESGTAKTGIINKEKKLKRNVEVFPEDCKKAYDLGTRLVLI